MVLLKYEVGDVQNNCERLVAVVHKYPCSNAIFAHVFCHGLPALCITVECEAVFITLLSLLSIKSYRLNIPRVEILH